MPQASEVEATVRAMLEAAGIPASEDEIAKFGEMYPALREGADRLWHEDWRYEEPVLRFAPLPPRGREA